MPGGSTYALQARGYEEDPYPGIEALLKATELDLEVGCIGSGQWVAVIFGGDGIPYGVGMDPRNHPQLRVECGTMGQALAALDVLCLQHPEGATS